MSNESDRKPYTTPESPRVISTLGSAASIYAGGSGSDMGMYSSYA